MSTIGPCVVVVPCYNEAARLDIDSFHDVVTWGATSVLFVDDGSTDQTNEVLARVVAGIPGSQVLTLPKNRGKAEAVRLGLRHALAHDAAVVGYLDADLSTPIAEYLRLQAVLLDADDIDIVLGSRVALLGADIERRSRRHYLGRVFGTLASASLQMRVYDTQCGAKVFRRTPALLGALSEPFLSRWVFDVELIGRLKQGSRIRAGLPLTAFREVPLKTWHDQPGGNLGVKDMAGALVDLARIARRQRERRSTS